MSFETSTRRRGTSTTKESGEEGKVSRGVEEAGGGKKGPTRDFQLANKKEKQSIMFEGLHSRPARAESRKMKWDKTRICKVVCSFRGVVRGGKGGVQG